MRSKWKGAYCSPELKNILIDSFSDLETENKSKDPREDPRAQQDSDLDQAPGGPLALKGIGTKQKPYLVYSRSSTILPDFIGKFVNIHNGHTWKTLEIKHLHVGYKFGELAITKKSPRYKMKFKK
jgi:ribosomal protein S19